jgi:hypothetical protein
MEKRYPPRPDQDFRITSVGWHLDIEARHREAGFPAVGADVILRRYWQFIHFLQKNNLTVHTIAESRSNITFDAELRSFDLTDSGYRFVQRYSGRWLDRTHKDSGAEKEMKILEKWYAQFMEKEIA